MFSNFTNSVRYISNFKFDDINHTNDYLAFNNAIFLLNNQNHITVFRIFFAYFSTAFTLAFFCKFDLTSNLLIYFNSYLSFTS